MRAINGFVFVLPDEVGEVQTPSGLILPESKEAKVSIGTIVSAAETVLADGKWVNLSFYEGQKVLYSPSLGVRYGKYLIFRLVDLYAILEN